MSDSIKKQINQIKSEIGRMGSDFTKGIAKQIEEDFHDVHQMIIDQFYDAHDPSKYNRSYGLYNSARTYCIKNKTNSNYTVGINVSSDFMQDYYKTEKENVFDLMWIHGVRGLPKQGNLPLSLSYTFQGHSFQAGERWENPYWSGESDPYHNIFIPTIHYGNYTTNSKMKTPNNVMYDFVMNWDKANGKATCDRLYKEIKNRYK